MPLPLAIIDIDGVVADVRHRLHHLESKPKNWDGFFGDAIHDTVHEEGIAVVRRLEQDHDIYFLTGRPERCRADTEKWLHDNDLGGYPVQMRPENLRMSGATMKVQALRRLRKNRVIGIVVDDDASVIAAVKQDGLPTLHATWEKRSDEEQQDLFSAQHEEGRS